ncbi:putative Kinesin, partial [Globisporangium splendens]
MDDENASGMLVAVRLRPLTDGERRLGHRECCRVIGDQASQDEVYAKTVMDIVPTILNGYHATIFAYGATGAGKTHTMMGSERDGIGELEDFNDSAFEVDGIIPHALADIFSLIQHRKQEEAILKLSQGSAFEWKVLISYLEVYNEQIRDLLQPSPTPLALREDQARGIVHVAGLHHEEAHSVGEVLQLLRRGNRNRKTEPTAANVVSSRSHAVIQVIIRHTTTTMLSGSNPRKSIVEGKLSLIDLAGSERASTTQNRGMRLTEGANINKSLLALANCINSLTAQTKKLVRSTSLESIDGDRRLFEQRSRLKTKVQYRDSKLTHLLKNSLEGDCRLVMIANVNPSHACFDESHNTLKYANRAKNIKIRPKMHVTTAEMTYHQRIEKLEKENIQLRIALSEAQQEMEQVSISKRKSSNQDDISPNTFKKFKNFPWGEDEGSRGSNQVNVDPEDESPELEILHATIQKLEEEKAVLKNEVVGLRSVNQTLLARAVKAEAELKQKLEEANALRLQERRKTLDPKSEAFLSRVKRADPVLKKAAIREPVPQTHLRRPQTDGSRSLRVPVAPVEVPAAPKSAPAASNRTARRESLIPRLPQSNPQNVRSAKKDINTSSNQNPPPKETSSWLKATMKNVTFQPPPARTSSSAQINRRHSTSAADFKRRPASMRF